MRYHVLTGRMLCHLGTTLLLLVASDAARGQQAAPKIPAVEVPDGAFTDTLYAPAKPSIASPESLPAGHEAVVVVAAREQAGVEPAFGNGVVVSISRNGKPRVLTCAHLVRVNRSDRQEIRVGVFRHSLKRGGETFPSYVEVPAQILRADDRADLALLELGVALELTAVEVAGNDATESKRDLLAHNAVSIVPFGAATAIRVPPVRLQPGQSGTPAFVEGSLAALAQGYYPRLCSMSGGKWADKEMLCGFLAQAEPIATPPTPASSPTYFGIHVVDDSTGRGVPMVELRTVNDILHVTDSQGLVAFHEPGLMDQKVFFFVQSHGYELAKDGFGYRGLALHTRPGETATVRIRRLNIAERLYRITGGGIYRDSVLLGAPVPLKEPVLNGRVLGQDSVMPAVYRDKIYWFWGDTNRPAYPLGNFGASGATSEIPGKGGLDPAVGVDFKYFVDAEGFSRKMCPREGPGPVWLMGMMTLPDDTGRERLVCRYDRVKSLEEIVERGLAVFNDDKEVFEHLTSWDLKAPLYPDARPFRVRVGDVDYFYFPYLAPVPLVRVRADWRAIQDPQAYEAYTLTGGDKDGGPRGYVWQSGAAPWTHKHARNEIRAGRVKPEESLLQLRDIETGKPVELSLGVQWNAWRRRWVGTGLGALSDVWYAEADTPTGPWHFARRVITHDNYSFYWPAHLPFFDQDGGRTIFLEGTYTATFSGAKEKTPRYEYNQIRYRLRLDDSRLVLPVPVYNVRGADGASRLLLRAGVEELKAWPQIEAIAFFAYERGHAPGGAVAIKRMDLNGCDSLSVTQGDSTPVAEILFQALPVAPAPADAPGSVPLYEYRQLNPFRLHYGIKPPAADSEWQRSEKPLCRVWPSPFLVLPMDAAARPPVER